MKNIRIPNYSQLIEYTFKAIKLLGGSGKNTEINDKVAELMQLSEEVLSVPHLDSSSLSEVCYRCAWARTLLKNYGAIENSARCVWSITTDFAFTDTIDGEYVERNCKKPLKINHTSDEIENTSVEVPEEVMSWRRKLQNVIQQMDPYGFERLTQRLLRECGFIHVNVTKKSCDGGIDGTGKLRINGIISFNIAFQCKRYHGVVGAGDIRDFRGSLTTNIEKGIFITTGSFSKIAMEEASAPGKKQIDLIDGEEFITKLAELGIGVRETKNYEIDEVFFLKI